MSRGYTRAEKALAADYVPGDVVAFHRPYKRIGVEKGDERRVVEIDHRNRAVMLEGRNGGTVEWKPVEIAGRTGGAEVFRIEEIELRAGDRVRWTRNDRDLKLVNSRAAEVVAVNEDRVSFRLDDGRMLDLDGKQSQLRHVDHAWASTVHAFQGRTVDNVIAAMEANHPHLTTQKSLYVEISRARDRAELVTDDVAQLRERLETATGERISALEAIAQSERDAREKSAESGMEPEREGESEQRGEAERRVPARSRDEPGEERRAPIEREPAPPAREKSIDVELELEL